MMTVIEDRVRAMDPRRASEALTRHMYATQAEGLALAQLEGYAVAQLHAITQLPARLRSIVDIVEDPERGVGLRLGLHAVVRGVVRHAELAAELDVTETALLEPTLVLERVLAALQPWIPHDHAPAGRLLSVLELGVREFMRPIVRARVASSWRYFHRLSALGAEVLRGGVIAALDDAQLVALLRYPAARAVVVPTLPELRLDPGDVPVPRAVRDTGSLEILVGS